MKTIVTHFSPDVDSICSVWLVKRFLPGFSGAKTVFVPAGSTLNGEVADNSSEVIHVDTGFGMFDHHQTDKKTCASRLVYNHLKKENSLKKSAVEVLNRITNQVTDIDHFQQVFWPEAADDRYSFFIDEIIEGLKLVSPADDHKIIDIGITLFDGVYQQMANKIHAEKLITEEGITFKTRFGKALGLETINDETVHLAQKKGYKLVVRKDPKKGYVRIKSWPLQDIDLTGVYNKLQVIDKEATWFLHASKHMLLNGSTKNPKMRPTRLSLEEIIKIIKEI